MIWCRTSCCCVEDVVEVENPGNLTPTRFAINVAINNPTVPIDVAPKIRATLGDCESDAAAPPPVAFCVGVILAFENKNIGEPDILNIILGDNVGVLDTDVDSETDDKTDVETDVETEVEGNIEDVTDGEIDDVTPDEIDGVTELERV